MQSGQIYVFARPNGQPTRPKTDDDDRLVATDAFHAQVHNANGYEVSHVFTAIADGAYADLLIYVANGKECHAEFAGAAGGDAFAYLYEGPTVSINGPTLTPVNLNRTSTNTATTLFYHTSTLTASGTALLIQMINGGQKNQSFGGATEARNEWILKENTWYLARIQNKAGGAKNFNVSVAFYEEDE